MSCLNLEMERSLSRQVSTDEAEMAGIWTRVMGVMMMMYMACSTGNSENKPNSRSEQIDGWMGATQGSTNGPREKPKKKSSAARILGTFTISTPCRRGERGRPPSMEYPVQGATTHRGHARTHTHIISGPGRVRPTCNRRTAPVQRHTRPIFVGRSIVAARSTSINDSGSWGREFLSRAPAPAQGSSSQTVEPQSDDTRPAASAAARCFCRLLLLSATLPVLSVVLSVWQSVCLVCACSVPSTYAAKSSVPPPLVCSHGQAERPHSRG